MNKKEEDIFFELDRVLDRNDTEAAESIITSHPDVLSAKWKGMTPLYVACLRNRLNAARFLLSHGADINAGRRFGYTPLDLVCHLGYTGLVRLLLEKGAAIDSLALNVASYLGHAMIVRILLDHGADTTINMRDEGGWTPLHAACECRKKSVVSLLLKAGANPWIEDRKGMLPIDIMRSKAEGPAREGIERVFDRDGGVNESTLRYYREKYPARA